MPECRPPAEGQRGGGGRQRRGEGRGREGPPGRGPRPGLGEVGVGLRPVDEESRRVPLAPSHRHQLSLRPRPETSPELFSTPTLLPPNSRAHQRPYAASQGRRGPSAHFRAGHTKNASGLVCEERLESEVSQRFAWARESSKLSLATSLAWTLAVEEAPHRRTSRV